MPLRLPLPSTFKSYVIRDCEEKSISISVSNRLEIGMKVTMAEEKSHYSLTGLITSKTGLNLERCRARLTVRAVFGGGTVSLSTYSPLVSTSDIISKFNITSTHIDITVYKV